MEIPPAGSPPRSSLDGSSVPRGRGSLGASELLWDKTHAVRERTIVGVKGVRVMVRFLEQWAQLEETYGTALLKATRKVESSGYTNAVSVWAPRLTGEGWGGLLQSLGSVGNQHVGLGICIRQNIQKGLEKFAAIQATRVQGLVAELQAVLREVETLQQQYQKAKGGYEKACIETTKHIETRNRVVAPSDPTSTTNTTNPTTNCNTVEDSHGSNKEKEPASGSRPAAPARSASSMLGGMTKMFEKAGEGIGKVGMAMAQGVSAELEERVRSGLLKVDAMEDAYISAIMALNGSSAEFETATERKVQALRENEKNRVSAVFEYLARLHQATDGTVDKLLAPGGAIVIAVTVLQKATPKPDPDGAAFVEFIRSRPGQSGAWGDVPAIEVGENMLPGALEESMGGQGEEEARQITEAVSAWGFEAANLLTIICNVLGDKAVAEETYCRGLQRLLENEGYASDLPGMSSGSSDLTDLLQRSSLLLGPSSPSSVHGRPCATVLASECEQLNLAWEAAAVGPAKEALTAHLALAMSVGENWCVAVSRLQEEARTLGKRATRATAETARRLATAKATHQKALARHQRAARDVIDKQDAVLKAKGDGGPSPTPAGNEPGYSGTPTPGGQDESTTAGAVAPLTPGYTTSLEQIGAAFGIPAQPPDQRVKAMETRLTSAQDEKSTAHESLLSVVSELDASLGGYKAAVAKVAEVALTEEKNRRESLEGILFEVAEGEVAAAHVMEAEQLKGRQILLQGLKDEELDACADQLAPSGSFGNVSPTGTTGQVLFMPFGGDLLTKERSNRPRTIPSELLPRTVPSATAVQNSNDDVGVATDNGGDNGSVSTSGSRKSDGRSLSDSTVPCIKPSRRQRMSLSPPLLGRVVGGRMSKHASMKEIQAWDGPAFSDSETNSMGEADSEPDDLYASGDWESTVAAARKADDMIISTRRRSAGQRTMRHRRLDPKGWLKPPESVGQKDPPRSSMSTNDIGITSTDILTATVPAPAGPITSAASETASSYIYTPPHSPSVRSSESLSISTPGREHEVHVPSGHSRDLSESPSVIYPSEAPPSPVHANRVPALMETPPTASTRGSVVSLTSTGGDAEAVCEDSIIESYSCALYINNLPMHGRLSLSADAIRFAGWRATKLDLRLHKIVGIEKTTMLMLPSALTITTKDGQKYTLGSLLYRDDCYALIKKLLAVSQNLAAIQGPVPVEGGVTTAAVECEEVVNVSAPQDSELATGRYEMILDVELKCSAAQAMAWLWSTQSTFWVDFCSKQGEENLYNTAWEPVGEGWVGLGGNCYKDEPWEHFMSVSFDHLRPGAMIGPRAVATRQLIAFRHNGGTGGVVALTSDFSGMPMLDSFTVCQRLVFRDIEAGKSPRKCQLQCGVEVVFRKSVGMLKGKIKSGALDEAGAMWRQYHGAVLKAIAYQRSQLGDAVVDTCHPSTLLSVSLLFEKCLEIQVPAADIIISTESQKGKGTRTGANAGASTASPFTSLKSIWTLVCSMIEKSFSKPGLLLRVGVAAIVTIWPRLLPWAVLVMLWWQDYAMRELGVEVRQALARMESATSAVEQATAGAAAVVAMQGRAH